MSTIRAGKFEVEVAEGGYPVWVKLKYCGDDLPSLHHKELADLEYVVRRAIWAAKMELQRSGDKYAAEVG